MLAGASATLKPVEVSSDESRGEEEEEEDSEEIPEGMGENSPLSKADILHALPDDAEVVACQEVRELPLSRQGGHRWSLRMLPPLWCRLGPALALPLHHLLLSVPVCPLLGPRRFWVSGSPSVRCTMSQWINKCFELHLVLACTCYFLMFALG